MKPKDPYSIPLGPQALIVSKHYYGALGKCLEQMDIDRYFSVLHYVSAHKGCTQQEICDALAIDKTAMVKVMNYLEKSRYVAKKSNPADRREHVISLTQKGKSKMIYINRAFKLLDEAAFSGLSAKQKAAYTELTQRILGNLRALPSHELFFNFKVSAGGGVPVK